MSDQTEQPEQTPNRLIQSPQARKSIYHVLAAVFAVLAIYGLITAEEAEQYLEAAVLLLGVAGPELAAGNTPKRGGDAGE